MSKLTPENLKLLFENSKQPLVVKNHLKWKILEWDIEKWSQIFNTTELKFRKGQNTYSTDIQWNNQTEAVLGSFTDFLDYIKDNNNGWLYFDYKYLHEYTKDLPELLKCINWSDVGLQNTVDQSVLWVGSKGAHTPCHIDTYGYNVVTQIYGKKMWLLFPNEENLLPSRLPYEQSSIFSQINFFCPQVQHIRKFNKCRKVILEPGDILFVPNGWWHYVECLDTSISVNSWVDMEQDDEKRLEEAIVRMFILQFTKDANEMMKNKICLSQEDKECINIENQDIAVKAMEFCLEKTKQKKVSHNISQEVINFNHENLQVVPILSPEDCFDLLKNQTERFNKKEKYIPTEKSFTEKILEVLTDPEVVNLIKSKLLNK